MLSSILLYISFLSLVGSLWALQLHSHPTYYKLNNKLKPNYMGEYCSLWEIGNVDDMINTRTLMNRINNLARIKHCLSFKYGLSETTDIEDHDIMKDIRTSFLPYDSTILPAECLDQMIDAFQNREFDTSSSLMQPKRKRVRRAHKYPLSNSYDFKLDTINEGSKHFSETALSLKSFWNEEGTKKSIREAQARTMKKYMDININPCEDFYKYACGNWEKHHPIPRDKAGFDTFEMLRENLDLVLKELLETKRLERLNPYPPKNILYETNVDKAHDGNGHELQKQQIRNRIIKKRNTLNRILIRYRRQALACKENSKAVIANNTLIAAHTDNKHRNAFYLSRSKLMLQEQNQSNYLTKDAQIKARHLYQSCINTKLLQERGIQPLLDLINSLGGWPLLNNDWNAHEFDWLNLTANLRRYNNDILIVEWVGPDIKNSDENIIQFDQTNLGLPTREYYLQEVNLKYLRAYQTFMSEVMHKLGAQKIIALKTAANLVEFETQLASITSPAEKRLNVTKLYKRMSLKQLHAVVPQINWMKYLRILQDRDINENEEVVIYAIEYMQNLVNLIDNTLPHTLANYLIWRFVRHRINNVDDRFDDIKQIFYHALFGREEAPSRWKVCISQVNTNMGMALGAMFVRKYFDENSKKDTLKMTHELQQAFRDILQTTEWLDSNTKSLAEVKVNAMSLKIGYPDFILNPEELNKKYFGIDILPDQYFENTLNVLLHTTRVEQNKLSEPVNRTTWQTAPAIVNAYYSRNKNQIMFPAGILQPPFYHRHFPKALNYGGIGVVIGHELTHGFDDKGRLFDSNGSIHKWWSDKSIKGFDERARCIIAQYGNYTVGEVGIALNGESTQGENIADNGGIRQSFHAYKTWLKKNSNALWDELLPGLNMTGEQLFFLNFGQVWCGAMRPEAVRNKLNTAIHSPGKFRVIGTLSNSEEFAKHFNCKAGTPMNPKNKCSVW